MQLDKFGQKMAGAKYPASHGNVSHIQTFIGVFCFKTSQELSEDNKVRREATKYE